MSYGTYARLVVSLLVGFVGGASARELPGIDVFTESRATRSLPSLTGFTRELVERGTIAHREDRLGVPTFFWAPQGAENPALRDVGLSPEQAARRFLFTYAQLYRYSSARLAEAPLSHVHDTGHGVIIATFHQKLGGLEVFRDSIKVAMTRELKLVAISGYLTPHTLRTADFALSHQTAVSIAFGDLTGQPLSGGEVAFARGGAGGYTLWSAPGRTEGMILVEPARVKKVLFSTERRLEPSYYVEVHAGASSAVSADYYSYVISARDGRLLFRRNLTQADSFSYRVWADPTTQVPLDGPQGSGGSPHPTGVPNGYQAPFVAPSLVTLQNGPIATNDPWLAANATVTAGNNADAYADLSSPNGFGNGDLRASTNGVRTFDRTYDVAADPAASSAQIQAAVTQIFYDVNFFHDWYYDVGFDEKSGNAQESNFGRGGLEKDALNAEGQDYSGTNNANMSTPSDGAHPQMQMYVFDGVADVWAKQNSPSTVTYNVGDANFGPQSYTVTANLVLAEDGGGPDTNDACSNITNSVSGKIALINRGNCTFLDKVQRAEAAGAVGVIIANNVAGGPPPLYGQGNTGIPAQSVSQNSGNALKAALAGGTVNMTLYRQGSVSRDGTLDNQVIAHEWGHFISNRLVGNAAGLSNNQGGGMGEGWGDVHALLITVRKGDDAIASNANWAGTYGMSTYVSSGGANEGYYFGMRRVPYSTDVAKNGLTFKHISDGVALPANVPTQFGLSGADNSEVHNAGEVWATMLWECYAALLRATGRLTFEQAQDRFRAYLVAGYKLTPNAPTFLEGRDAILAAAFANDPADMQALAAAFAKRGAGLKAVAPDRSSSSNSPVTESYITGSDLALVKIELSDATTSCDHDGNLDANEAGVLTVTLKNVGTGTLSHTTGKVSSTQASVTIGNGGNLTFPTSQPYSTVQATVPISMGAATGIQSLELKVEINDQDLAVAGPSTVTVSQRANFDVTANTSATDDVEAPTTTWTVASDPNLYETSPWRVVAYGATDHRWFGPDPGDPEDQYLISPKLNVGSGNFGFTFQHRYDFEFDQDTNYDGAVLELTQDDGQTWVDVGSHANPGYTGQLDTSTQTSNPLRGRQAYVQRSASWPDLEPVTVSLGKTYAGKTVRMRFRIGSDDAANMTGWEVDDISFTGITNLPFASVVPDRNACTNQQPVARIGGDVSVTEGQKVELDGSTSSDPDGEPLTYQWTQMSGPAATMMGSTSAKLTVTGPAIPSDTDLVFQLVVSDGRWPSAPVTAKVTVHSINQAPVADAGPDQQVAPAATVALDGSASSDPDSDALSFAWTQTGGPAVTLSDPSKVQPTFTAPAANCTLRFELVVSDGVLSSAPAKVEITVGTGNKAPIADAGSAQTVAAGALVTLDGSASSDPDGSPLSYKWVQVSGPTVELSSATDVRPTLTAPKLGYGVTLAFALTVNDGTTDSVPAVTDVVVGADSGCGCGNSGAPTGPLAMLVLGLVALRAWRRRA